MAAHAQFSQLALFCGKHDKKVAETRNWLHHVVQKTFNLGNDSKYSSGSLVSSSYNINAPLHFL